MMATIIVRLNTLLFLALFIATTNISAVDDPKKEAKDKYSAGTFTGLSFRCIGPAMTSGRIADMAVHPTNSNIRYIAAASGGVWKTSNAGVTYSPIFDGQGSYSIGCITLDPNNPNVVWVGTGENNNQRSVAYGDGIYKSEDGGKTWKNMGLKNSERIGMIRVDPRNSDRVFVAAYGPIWNSGDERGVYLTEDGGKTWNRILKPGEYAGINEIHMDPRNPDWMYATAHQRARRVWTYISGGPESGIYRSKDGGKTWDKLENGLPKGDVGRIGMAVSPHNPDILYAIIEATDETQGTYRSEDRGASWKKLNKYTTSGNYYVELFCDPVRKDRIYSMDTYCHVSDDGGASWKKLPEKYKHVDNHSMWIDPAEPTHYVMGCDGGIYETWDDAQTWHFHANLPVTQFYKVSVDNAEPFYNITGGTQDNFSLVGPSQTTNRAGIVNSDWTVTLGGDGFEGQIDPTDPDIMYSQWQYGNLVRYNKRSGERIKIQPIPGKDEKPYRWNWDAPLLISPHDNMRLYFAANVVFRSDNRGDNWKTISGDLSRQIDRNKLPVMGKVWSIDAVAKNQSTSIYGNITGLDESPKQEDLLYAGTDDGLIHISENAGGLWKKVDNFPGVPERTYVNQVLASQHEANVVYAAFNNHKNGDFKPYLLKSTDKGANWTSISGNLPERGSVYSIAEDHINKDLLFAGTEFGVFFTTDGGQKWVQLKGGIPIVAVRDIAIQRKENDLVLATFGRGFYVLDDYSALRDIDEEKLKNEKALLFAEKNGKMFIPSTPLGRSGKTFQGDSYFTAPNAQFGVTFTYYLKDKPKSLKEVRRDAEKAATEKGENIAYPTFDALRAEAREVAPYLVFEIKDKNGNIVRRLTSSPKTGLQRIVWDYRYDPQTPVDPKAKKPKDPWADYNAGRMVLPGIYTVRMLQVVRDEVLELTEPVSFTVNLLGINKLQGTDRVSIDAFSEKVAALQNRSSIANGLLGDYRKRIDYYRTALIETPGVPIDLNKAISALDDHLYQISIQLHGDKDVAKYEFETSPSVNERIGNIVYWLWRSTEAVPESYKTQYGIAYSALKFVEDELKSAKTKIQNLEQQLKNAGVGYMPGLE
jgi:photosystem II stability/assembly factor-like uncharacterized protein